MIKNLEEFFIEAGKYMAWFNLWAEKYLPTAKADHLGYKCADSAEFEALRALLENHSTFVYQSIVSKRRDAIIKFLAPLPSVLGEVFYFELADQKPDGSQTSGFDHIEIYPTSGSVEDLVNELATKGMVLEKIERPHHVTFDGVIADNFKVRLEAEALIEKIKAKEIF